VRRIANAVAGAAFVAGTVLNAQTAHAAQTTHDTTVYPRPSTPAVQPLDCHGTTGTHGCGAGWVWRDGWLGWRCYAC
jgi:hypothetical protein